MPIPELKPNPGTVKLVLAFDIGTTQSGVSYCILEPHRVPKIHTVTRFPGKRGVCKVPSLLYYDKDGTVRAAGAEALAENVIQTAQTEGWTKAECWKLHLHPNSIDEIPPLPSGKSVLDVLTDFIKYLFRCCKTYVQEEHSALIWSSLEHSIEYVLTYPGCWGEQRRLYCRAIELAGLVPSIPEAGPAFTHVLTEGGAALNFCSHLLNQGTDSSASRQGVVIIDAGGGIIDLSMFSITSNPMTCKEIAPTESRLQGSIFVNYRAEKLIQSKLNGWEQLTGKGIDKYVKEFDQTTKLTIKSDKEKAYIQVAAREEVNERYGIYLGHLELSGPEATALIDDSIDAIIDAFERQRHSTGTQIRIAILVGGLSANEWLWDRLQKYFVARNISIRRPDYLSKNAVAHGAVLSHVDHENRLVVPTAVRSAYDLIEHDFCRMLAEKATLEGTVESVLTINRAYKQQRRCEALCSQGRIKEAAESLINFVDTACEVEETDKDKSFVDWFIDFAPKCVLKLEATGDDKAVVTHPSALPLAHSITNTVLYKWAKIVLNRGSANEVSGAVAAKWERLMFSVRYMICDILERDDRLAEAITCYREIIMELRDTGSCHGSKEHTEWEEEFLHRCLQRLEKRGDGAINSRNYEAAAHHFSTMLSLNPRNRFDIHVKRSEAWASMNEWEGALSDADEAIKINPACHRGHERRHAALLGRKQYAEAVKAFDVMLSTPGVDVIKYVDARLAIRRIVDETLGRMPQVLIDTITGRLQDRQQLAKAFMALPIYSELVSSMTRQLDEERIKTEVKSFYRYVMLSHRWDVSELLHKEVKNISIYDLSSSLANDKLREFCSLARSLSFQWAWSDNSCVDRSDPTVLHGSLVSMFMWYRGSSLTVVYLRGVWSKSQRHGDLSRSTWNTRAWTYQEYVAADTIQFYTEDWKPYLGLTLFNHKESPAIISEMQQVSGVSAKEMAILRPGQDRVRQKLYLASRRKATYVEDIAYSLFGIFDVALPIIYGETNKAMGRLLEQILTGSGDATILAWTGSAGSYNSCLPMDLTVYDSLVPPHVPRLIEKVEMNRIVTTMRQSRADLSLSITLHNQLKNLPLPSMVSKRLRLPGIVIPLTHASEQGRISESRIYRATTQTFGEVEFKTADDLTGKGGLCLVHPWIRPLRDQEFSDGATGLDKVTQALRFVARLRQPFGALLFEQSSSVDYRRVAADCLIMVQIREEVSLTELIHSIHVIEVL